MKQVLSLLWTMTAATAAFGHGTPTHQTLMDYAIAKAAELDPALVLSGTFSNRLHEGAADEDNGTRSLDHGYNPLTNGKFPLAGLTAREAAADRWASMVSAFLAGNLDGGDGSGAWHFLGRASHLIQDMSSPLHVFALQHASPSCKFEDYWQANDTFLRSLLVGIGPPLPSNTLDVYSTERLDPFTVQRLQYRFENSCPNKSNDDIRGWAEVLAWTTYFRSTFWAELTFGTDGSSGIATAPLTTGTAFSDGFVEPQTNTLHVMFPNHVRWIAAWYDNYYEITDRNGYVFRWMSWMDVDDFCSCGSTDAGAGGWGAGQQDSSKLVVGSGNDDRGARTTGRFFFDLRELGKDTSGNFNRFCYPFNHPDGTGMTNHLHQYLGSYLDPLTVRYNAGLLGLANRRVQVKTADSIVADNFTWSRRDNFGSGPSFSVGSVASNFYFVAKSEVTLTAPATNRAGRLFHRWLRNGATFPGNTNHMITINTSAAPIPAAGAVYTADFNADLDDDDLPDWWEQQYFGVTTVTVGTADSDGDGWSNWHEYRLGTDPTNAASRFAITHIEASPTSGQLILRWPSVSGKRYRVTATTNLTEGFNLLLQTNIPATPPSNAYTTPVWSVPCGFFRVELEAP